MPSIFRQLVAVILILALCLPLSVFASDTRNRLTNLDATGNVKTIQSSNASGANLAYSYDALNWLSVVTDLNGQTGYDNVGNLGGFTYPNGVQHSYTYDNRNRLTNLSAAGPTGPVAGYGYTLDASGHRLSVTEQSGRTVNYGYDNLYRLTRETIASDPNGVNGASMLRVNESRHSLNGRATVSVTTGLAI